MAKFVYKKYEKKLGAWSAEVYSVRNYRGGIGVGYGSWSTWNGNEYVRGAGSGGSDWEYTHSNGTLVASRIFKNGTYCSFDDDMNYTCDIREEKYTRTRNYEAGTYIGEVIAEDGTYPANGVHTDGYWYVRVRQVFPEMWVNMNGAQRKCEAGWVNISGTWKVIEEIYVNINGVWRKSE